MKNVNRNNAPPKFVGQWNIWIQNKIENNEIITYWYRETEQLGRTGMIREAIELPNSDILLGIQQVDECCELEPYMDYVLLNEIKMWQRLWQPEDMFDEELYAE